MPKQRSAPRWLLRVFAVGLSAAGMFLPAAPQVGAVAGPSPKDISGSEIATYDITLTTRGQTAAHATAQRWADTYGYFADTAALKVYDFGSVASPDLLVVPPDFTIEEVFVGVAIDGTVEVSQTVSLNFDAYVGNIGLSEAPYWQMVGHACFARDENNTAWMDECYKMHQLKSDGNGSEDYYQLEHFATAKSKSIWNLRGAWLESWKHTTSANLGWLDWSPRSDLNVGGCRSYSIGVSVYGVGISSSHEQCEVWDITKFAAAGHFKNEWKGNVNRQEREVAYMQAVWVPQRGWPRWFLNNGYYAR